MKRIASLLEIIESKNHLTPIINEIEKVIMNTADINDATILEIASLVADLQSELLFAGYPEDVIKKFLDEFEFSYEKQDVNRRPLIDQFISDLQNRYWFLLSELKHGVYICRLPKNAA